jgi:peptidoglycan/LPS O-acetylase OafA/YrhL
LWTFTINWAQPFGADVSGFSHFWSLAVEEQFYLVWPFVVLLAIGTRLLWICIALVLVALLSRAVMQAAEAKPEMIYMFTFCRMDALAMGAAMAVVSLSAPAMQWITGHSRAVLAVSVRRATRCGGVLAQLLYVRSAHAGARPDAAGGGLRAAGRERGLDSARKPSGIAFAGCWRCAGCVASAATASPCTCSTCR